jgi:multicomponent Na+:H+ antiporter subunit D
MVHHIIVQTTLFLAVGLVERRAGSTSILKVKGLMRAAPLLAVLFFIPAINLGGLPPFSGFIGKLALFDAAAEVGTPLMYLLIVGGIVTSLLTLYTLMRAWNLAFWREDDDHSEETGVVERISYLGDAPAPTTRRAPRHSAHHDRDDGGDGRGHGRPHGLRRSPLRAVREHRRRAAHARDARAARRRGGS